MESTVNIKTFAPPPINKKEIMRYAGAGKMDAQLENLINECIKEAEKELTYKVCYAEFPVNIYGSEIDFGFAEINSHDLAKNLCGCGSAVIFAATVGIGIDRLILKYSAVSPAKAVIMQALGAERIEALCDAFNKEVSGKKSTRPRFSAGYGDFPLAAQKDICAALSCDKKIGVTLNSNLLMSPTKSVTAIIGVEK